MPWLPALPICTADAPCSQRVTGGEEAKDLKAMLTMKLPRGEKTLSFMPKALLNVAKKMPVGDGVRHLNQCQLL